MQRKNSRRFTSNVRENSEQEFGGYRQGNQSKEEKQESPDRYENKSSDSDNLIADMAQGFIQAQAKMTDHGGNVNNLEIALLLQKVNNQLEEMKKTTQSPPKQDLQQQNSTQGNNTQETDQQSANGLQALLNSVLQGKGNNKNNEKNGKESSKSQSSADTQFNGGGGQQNTMAVQTVSQVLAQAQYELANELESSLKKLKQVISESEKLANNISNLLGEESLKK